VRIAQTACASLVQNFYVGVNNEERHTRCVNKGGAHLLLLQTTGEDIARDDRPRTRYSLARCAERPAQNALFASEERQNMLVASEFCQNVLFVSEFCQNAPLVARFGPLVALLGRSLRVSSRSLRISGRPAQSDLFSSRSQAALHSFPCPCVHPVFPALLSSCLCRPDS